METRQALQHEWVDARARGSAARQCLCQGQDHIAVGFTELGKDEPEPHQELRVFPYQSQPRYRFIHDRPYPYENTSDSSAMRTYKPFWAWRK